MMSYQIRITDESGNVQPITIVENDEDLATVPAAELGDDRESYGLLEDRAIAKLKDIHSTIQAYSRYAIGAFQNLPGAEVEEVTLKFGITIEGSTGLPLLTGGSAGANFEIEVKCKPKAKQP
ncbi:hypothetical protein PROH_10535 [Prochlorothrix hollandica PCC 9006 = CALU 1027]|uniref:Trypsin-co-occurring domain-containing protein n=2 Tax=Prochlorothrix hollandica TaxID=1223 RepID=A0A0M2Q1Q6_PROHO|nr:hypothetical protein PROH_10535 [Prochlorothrix hollandica PCC 9006 = CALU 1027]